MHIYNEKDQAGHKDIQVHSWRGQTAQEMVEPCLVLKEIKKKGVKGGFPSGQDPSQLILQLVGERKRP